MFSNNFSNNNTNTKAINNKISDKTCNDFIFFYYLFHAYNSDLCTNPFFYLNKTKFSILLLIVRKIQNFYVTTTDNFFF